jgi:Chaperonin 10 Kd subunit
MRNSGMVSLGFEVGSSLTHSSSYQKGPFLLPLFGLPQEGEVIAVGPGRVSNDGTRIPMELTVGDRVIYSKYAGMEYKDGDEEYLLIFCVGCHN